MGTQIRAVVITASDACARGLRPDESGEVLRQLLVDVGAVVVDSEILSDDPEPLIETLRRFAARSDINLIITTGGTGLGPRDNTPEATRAVVERDVPGIAEAIRAESRKVTPMAMISRGVCGICCDTLIVNLPGSPKAVRESFLVIKPVLNHAVDLLAGRTRHDQ
ncbi:MAG TPA: MogA/MoaB family molybdenum cofactor biosynthesis protein [Pyrinomonadaceae bacterium]|nr:MogA/MoaB family molybdenum cofactor biosynthesis protein [Pyrinomonadaceae bacterium]